MTWILQRHTILVFEELYQFGKKSHSLLIRELPLAFYWQCSVSADVHCVSLEVCKQLIFAVLKKPSVLITTEPCLWVWRSKSSSLNLLAYRFGLRLRLWRKTHTLNTGTATAWLGEIAFRWQSDKREAGVQYNCRQVVCLPARSTSAM